MPQIDARILKFMARHHVMTLATVTDNTPHCSNLVYAWIAESRCFVVTSSSETFHGRQVNQNPWVAGSIVLETKIVGKLQGLQFRGRMVRPEPEEFKQARRAYLARFPYATFVNLELWIIRPDFMKLTDNRLGFGKKLIWEEMPRG